MLVVSFNSSFKPKSTSKKLENSTGIVYERSKPLGYRIILQSTSFTQHRSYLFTPLCGNQQVILRAWIPFELEMQSFATFMFFAVAIPFPQFKPECKHPLGVITICPGEFFTSRNVIPKFDGYQDGAYVDGLFTKRLLKYMLKIINFIKQNTQNMSKSYMRLLYDVLTLSPFCSKLQSFEIPLTRRIYLVYMVSASSSNWGGIKRHRI